MHFMKLPESANRNILLLLFTEKVSKAVVLTPMLSATSAEVAEVFVWEVFCWFGMPKLEFGQQSFMWFASCWEQQSNTASSTRPTAMGI
jgi:hypothetical protein